MKGEIGVGLIGPGVLAGCDVPARLDGGWLAAPVSGGAAQIAPGGTTVPGVEG